MHKSLDIKLANLARHRFGGDFILADAKDADMAFGMASPGRDRAGRMRSLEEFRQQMREIVRQGLVDIMLMSASTSERLTITERLFDKSPVTPAVRANDTTDIHIVRGSCYAGAPSRPFSSATIEHIQHGVHPAPAKGQARGTFRGANLGLYSVTFNNLPEPDLTTMLAYKDFRLEAESKQFDHFLEVFDPNVAAGVHGIAVENIGGFVNDHIARMLAGVPSSSRPRFLKIAYHGPASMEELCGYDPSLIVGILGGSSGTTHDAFHLLHDAKKYGARIALFGRKINAAEHQLLFVEHLRRVADDELTPVEAVKSYHGALAKLALQPVRKLSADLALTVQYSAYAGSPGNRTPAKKTSTVRRRTGKQT